MARGGLDFSAFTRAKVEEPKELARLVRLITMKIAMDILSGVIRGSPVDTGRFKGNWQVSLGTATSGETGLLDKSGAAALANGVGKITAAPPYSRIILHNNVPYAGRLASGWSAQAPAGWIDTIVDAATNLRSIP